MHLCPTWNPTKEHFDHLERPCRRRRPDPSTRPTSPSQKSDDLSQLRSEMGLATEGTHLPFGVSQRQKRSNKQQAGPGKTSSSNPLGSFGMHSDAMLCMHIMIFGDCSQQSKFPRLSPAKCGDVRILPGPSSLQSPPGIPKPSLLVPPDSPVAGDLLPEPSQAGRAKGEHDIAHPYLGSYP